MNCAGIVFTRLYIYSTQVDGRVSGETLLPQAIVAGLLGGPKFPRNGVLEKTMATFTFLYYAISVYVTSVLLVTFKKSRITQS